MGFYSTINTYYDRIFPLEQSTLDFVQSHCDESYKHIIEIGCATGELAIALAEKGYNVYGLDLNDGMIEKAEAKAQKKDVKVHFRLQDMMKLKWFFPNDSVDCVVCLGNTMAHVLDEGNLYSFLINVNTVLKYRGSFIFQIINYDRIFSNNIAELPIIDNDHITFARRYEYDTSKKLMRFNTTLKVKENEKVVENRIYLNPITYGKIDTILKKCGFSFIKYYGSYERDPYTRDSSLLIGVALK